MGGDSTCWTLVEGAARGDADARAAFAERYLPVMRAYLLARWRHPGLRSQVDDAVQDGFVECLRPGGALDRLDPAQAPGFRRFLFGVLKNVARRAEERFAAARGRSDPESDPAALPADDESLARVFDREYARSLVRQAGEHQARSAAAAGEEAVQRVELLRLRFADALPIREIAARWGVDAAWLHHQYARARQEFHVALRHVVAEHHPGTAAEIERECEQLLGLLA